MECNWSVPNPSAASAAALCANRAVVTPTGDEFEFLQRHRNVHGVALVPSAISSVDPMAATALVTSEPCFTQYPAPSSFAANEAGSGYSCTSYTPSASLASGNHVVTDVHADEGTDMMEAAQALCFLKALGGECTSQQHDNAVDAAMKMMSSDTTIQSAPHPQEGALLRCIAATEEGVASDNHVISNSLVHPDRLAIDDDVDEVNKLHQYVRKELLEIFVVPQISDSDSEHEDDDGEDYRPCKKPKKKNETATLRTTRSAAARRDSFTSATASICAAASTPTTTSSSSSLRNYPGRVGFRCVFCADCRHKPASKASFFPLRLTNIYREVCAWQRIHFKNCPMVPESVKEKYDHYKMIDTSRGKVRYWESSAKRIGLQNNPDRYVKSFLSVSWIS